MRLAGVYAVFGQQSWIILLGQTLSEAFVAFLIYEIAKMSFKAAAKPTLGVSVGALAAVGYAFFLPAQAYSSVLMPSCLHVAALWAVVWWCMRERKQIITTRETILLGVGTGLIATLVASILSVIPLVLVRLSRQKSGRWQNILIYSIGIIVGCSPVLYHNRVVANDAWVLTAHSGLNFFIGNNPESTGYLVIPPGLRANQAQMLTDSIAVAEKAIGRGPLPRSEVSQWWSDRAKTFIRENPIAWLRLLGQKVINFFNAYEYDDLSIIEDLREAGILTPGLRFGIISALGLAGLVVSVGKGFRQSRWVIAGLAIQIASVLTVFVTERYRLAAVPGLLIFAAYFLGSTVQGLLAKDWKRLLVHMILVAATLGFVHLPVPNDAAEASSNYNRGLRQLKQNRFIEAEKLLLEAWKYAPENENTNFALGNLYFKLGKNEDAKKYYRATLQSNPESVGAWNNLAQVALGQSMPATAIQFLEKSLALEPNQVRGLFLLAKAWLQNGSPEKAAEFLIKAKALDPRNEELLFLEKEIEAAEAAR